MIKHAAGILILVAVLALAGCMAASQTGNFSVDAQMIDAVEIPDGTAASDTPAPTVQLSSTPAYTPAFTAMPAITAEPTAESTPAPTAEPTAEPTPTATPEPTKSPEPTKTPTPTPKYEVTDLEEKAAYLNAGSANFRKGPGLDYKIIEELKFGAKFTVVGKSSDWFKVKYDSTYGFILAEFVEYGAPPTPTPKPTAKPTATPKPTKTPEPTAEPTKQPENTGWSDSNSGVSSNDYFASGGGFSADELLLIAQVVQLETKGNGVEARAAVANVIYNRIVSSRFPNSVSGVIFQKNQFTVANNEDKLRAVVPVSKTIEAVNQIFVNGDRFMPEDVLYFRSSSKGTSWNNRVYYATFGGNSFFY